MAFKINQNDLSLLKTIAEHRILTGSQIMLLTGKNKQVLWRRLRRYEKKGLISGLKKQLGQNRGRPESIWELTEVSVNMLKEKGCIERGISYEQISSENIHCVEHQLLQNWFIIHLKNVEQNFLRLKVKALANNSPFLAKRPCGHTIITDYATASESGNQLNKFTPDAVIGICDSATSKTCLFFLEVDCGTETVVSLKRENTDIRQKVINYQHYFQSQRYKRYEDVFKCHLHGFRLLFLTNSQGRLTALCRLTQEMQPSEFVWLTDYNRILSNSIAAPIWAKGGNLNNTPESIFGSLCQLILQS